MSTLLHDKRVWMALLAVAATAIKIYLPTFPAEMWASIEALLIVAIGALTVDNAATRHVEAMARHTRAMRDISDSKPQ